MQRALLIGCTIIAEKSVSQIDTSEYRIVLQWLNQSFAHLETNKLYHTIFEITDTDKDCPERSNSFGYGLLVLFVSF
jgi:hypothetical protein